MLIETITETKPDGTQLKVTREIKAKSPRCCICGVKLILDEVKTMMCIKCEGINSERLKGETSSSLEVHSKVVEDVSPEEDSDQHSKPSKWLNLH